jgi:hypothetical protein
MFEDRNQVFEQTCTIRLGIVMAALLLFSCFQPSYAIIINSND